MPKQNDSLPSLPKSIETEQIVLGKLLLDPEQFWPQIEGELSADDFFKTAHRLIFRAGITLFHHDKAADLVGVSHYLEEHNQLERAGGRLYLNLMIDRASDAFEDIVKYIEIIKRKAGMRRLAMAGGQISSIGYEGNGNLGLAQEKALEILNQALLISQDEVCLQAKDIGKAFIEKLKRWRSSERQGISTGFSSLDKYIVDIKGQLIVVAGSVSMGKTMMLLNMAYRQAKQGTPVGFISLEMSSEALIKRILQIANRISENELRYASDEKASLMVDALESLPLHFSEISTSFIANILKTMRSLVYRQGVKVVHIDYLQLIQGQGTKNRAEELGDIMKDLLHFAMKEKIAIIVGCQINRQPMQQKDDKRPKLWMLRSSGEIENSADVVLGLFRRSYLDYGTEDKIMEVHFLKNRNGRAGKTVKLACDLNKQRLDDLLSQEAIPKADYPARKEQHEARFF